MFSSQNSQVSNAANYIEDVFSTWLYTGNGSTQTITNGIDLSTKGGLVWNKLRSGAGSANHKLYDTARGVNKELYTNLTSAQGTKTDALNSFNTNGFTLGAQDINESGSTYATWTFRKQPKFFDVVTYTGNGVAGRTISHNLGSAPGCIILKAAQVAAGSTNWCVYHRSATGTTYLNLTNAQTGSRVRITAADATTFTVDADADSNWNGDTYVAYLFAHDAGGFGLTGTDNVISCGSFGVGGGSDGVVSLGWEPQWVMFKQAQVGGSGNWRIVDNMRGCSTGNTTGDLVLSANLSNAEADAGLNMIDFNATGFTVKDGSVQGGNPYIYIAIRRGPMKVPTDATKVFSSITNSATTGTVNTTGFPIDMGIVRWRDGVDNNYTRSRLQGISSTTTEGGSWFSTNSTAAEVSTGGLTRLWDNTGFQTTSGFSGYSTVYWNFGRAPSFFDEVCYTGTGGVYTTVNHNLGVPPELVIAKRRNAAVDWCVWTAAGNIASSMTGISVNKTNAAVYTGQNFTSYMLATTFTPGLVYNAPYSITANDSGGTYVAYLFATCPGVSKVGSYTGTGTTKQVDCGFAAGARFVLIKRTDSTGDWYVWDSARGIVSGNDPYLLLNSTAAETTSTDYIDPYSAGFELSSTAPAALNASGGTYIFLAIA